MKLLIDFKNELKIISEKLELADVTLIFFFFFFFEKEKFCLIVYKIFQQIIGKQISNSIGKFIFFLFNTEHAFLSSIIKKGFIRTLKVH